MQPETKWMIPHHSLRIVVAEDDTSSRKLLHHLLAKWGFDVRVAKNGLEAWEILRSEDVPTIAILDWMMPEMEGTEVSRRVRQLNLKHYVYIILLTAKADSQHVVEGLRCGADDYISKPFDPGELQARLLVATRIISVQKELNDAKERYRNLVENTTALICTHDLEGRVLSINPAAARSLGLTVEQCIGQNIRDSLVPEARPNFTLYLEQIKKCQIASGNMPLTSKSGSRLVWSYTNRLIQDGDQPPYVLGHAQDVTEQVELESALRKSQEAALAAERRLARVDPLTGLANRRAFYEGAELERKRALRHSRPLSVAYVDLDNFKQINDRMGHEVGDQLLIQIGSILQNTLRAEDLAARMGGDEFAILLPENDYESARTAVYKTHRMLTDMAKDKKWPVTFSIGMVTFSVPPESVEEIVRVADDLMYSVKHNGKNSIATSFDDRSFNAAAFATSPISRAQMRTT
jgi:diguanylate cyclase (GGDEF)-like protein/PAS domain S-box-containing protein